MKIIVLSPNKEAVFTDVEVSKLQAAGEVVFETEPKDIRQIPALMADEDKILALDPDFVGWKFTKEDIDAIPRLKAVCLQTTSFSWIDTAHAASKGIPVTNLRGFSTEGVAEYALFMALAVARKFPLVIKDGFKQDFIKHKGIELKGKRAGIIGLGNNGRRFAELCKGIGMEVIYWSRTSRDEAYRYTSVEEVMSTSDVIFPALAQNEETKNILTDDLLKAMKSSAIFVGTVHKIFNHQLLLDLVKENKIFGYAFEEDNGNPTSYDGNVFAVPAVGWCTDESMKKNGEMWMEVIEKVVQGSFLTKIN